MTIKPAALDKVVTLNTLAKLKDAGGKFSCVALYDAAMAAVAERSGVETIIIGDSLGMTVQGHSSTLPVTMNDMVYHTGAVRRGNRYSLLIADLPFMACATLEQAMANAARLMQAGANMVKIEGGDWLCETVQKLGELGIPVCCHLGLTPQSVNKLGGYRVQGRKQEQADIILKDALALQQAGADLLVLECVPTTLTRTIVDKTGLITIGIGAGADTDGQVLVINDLLGITPKAPKFSRNFLKGTDSIQQALTNFVNEVKSGTFPQQHHEF